MSGGERPFRVLEIAHPGVAPCGRLLAEAGLDIIKVEPPQGSVERSWLPQVKAGNLQTSAYTLFHDTGKQSITLDLSADQGATLFLRLVEQADVVLEGARPGQLAGWGLGYEALAQRNPAIVLASITPFGQTGPYSHFAANDLVVFALGGIMFISGNPGKPPVAAPDDQAYVVAGTHAALAVLAALWARRHSGGGDWIDVSMFECLAAQENTLTNYTGPRQFTRRNGSQHRTSLPGCIVPCQDGYVHLFISRAPRDWEHFLDWIGRPPELADPAWAEINTRWEHADVVMQATQAFVGPRTRADLYASAQQAHLPVTPVYSPADFLADPHTQWRRPVQPVQDGSYRTLRAPMGLVDRSPRGARPAGADNAAVYAELARLSKEERPLCQQAASSGVGAGLLSGLRICAFTHVAAGPYGTLQLGYLGADVIKVESTTRIDTWRYRDRNGDPERSRPFVDHNRNTLSVTLNLKTDEGVELARRLIARSDAVLDNYSAGVMDRLGLGYDALRKVKPDVIVLHMSGLGADGPHSAFVTFGPNVMSLAGLTWLWNHPDATVPVGSQSSYPDYLVGVYAAYALVAALHRRDQTGEGALIDLAQAEVTACAVGPSYVAALNGAGDDVCPLGNASRADAPHGCYPCQGGDDAWCVIAVEQDAQWEGLKQALGRPGWADDSALATRAGRWQRRAFLDGRVAEWTRSMSPHAVMRTCQANGVPSGVVATGEDLGTDPHLRERGFLVEMEHPRLGKLRLPGSPVRFANAPVRMRRTGPLLGHDNDYVLREILGLGDAEIADLAGRNALL